MSGSGILDNVAFWVLLKSFQRKLKFISTGGMNKRQLCMTTALKVPNVAQLA